MKKIRIYIIITLVLSFILCGCNKENKKADINNADVVEVSAQPVEITDETISLIAVGDNLLHMPVVNSGKQPDGSYDYSNIFKMVQPDIENADIAVIGQETVFAGEEFGYSGYPLFNSPSDVGVSLVNEGFDVILHASNHVLDKWDIGIENTLEFWKNYPEIFVLGINESDEEKNTVEIMEVKGAKIALLNYTYGANGFLPPQGKEYLVNFIDNDKIKRDAEYAEENADFTVAFMHWGTEYSMSPDSFQTELAKNMCEWGVDLIIGSHPHVIEPAEWIESENGNKMFVYYSLGNFVSRQLEAKNLLGGMADVKLHYDGEKVTIKECSFVPIVTHYNTSYNEFTVYPLSQYSDELAKGHGITPHDGSVSVKRWTDIVDKVFDGYDTSLIKY